ncbi:hypothetical protein ACOME3_002861 [Neoechinorhynchus agilis]
MSTVKGISAEVIQGEMEAFKSEQQAYVSKVNVKKHAKGLLKSASEASTKENNVLVDAINMPNSDEDSLETIGVQNTANISTITVNLAPPSLECDKR